MASSPSMQKIKISKEMFNFIKRHHSFVPENEQKAHGSYIYDASLGFYY